MCRLYYLSLRRLDDSFNLVSVLDTRRQHSDSAALDFDLKYLWNRSSDRQAKNGVVNCNFCRI